jgi:methylenetetrahydrofolate reductase (NADPH)
MTTLARVDYPAVRLSGSAVAPTLHQAESGRREVTDTRVMQAPSCPKHMTYGPCGGVRTDHRCEMAELQCPFSDGPVIEFVPNGATGTVDLPGGAERHSAVLELARNRPVILTDFTVRPFDAASIADVLGVLAGSCDAVLVGEHQNRPDFPPMLMAGLIADAGLRAWVTLSCRDRNRLVLEQDIAGLRHVGVDAVFCVTGDGRATGIRPGVTQVFDLDGTRLTAMAASAGLVAAVPESPRAIPRHLRPQRLLQKERAGASACVLNHVASAAVVSDFLSQAHAIGVRIPVIAAVAVYTDERSASVLQHFPGLELDDDRVRSVLGAGDSVSAGIAEAVREARELLAIEGVVGVNISGLASDRGELFSAEIKAEVGRRIAAQS